MTESIVYIYLHSKLVLTQWTNQRQIFYKYVLYTNVIVLISICVVIKISNKLTEVIRQGINRIETFEEEKKRSRGCGEGNGVVGWWNQFNFITSDY